MMNCAIAWRALSPFALRKDVLSRSGMRLWDMSVGGTDGVLVKWGEIAAYPARLDGE
jgi:hypothetical protein